MLAGAEVAARLVVAWIGLASHSSFAIGSGATCMFAHQFVFVAMVMKLPVVLAAEGHNELVADFSS